MPSRSIFFLKRLRALSRGSFSPTLITGIIISPFPHRFNDSLYHKAHLLSIMEPMIALEWAKVHFLNEITILKDIFEIDRLLGSAGKGEIALRLVAVICSSTSSWVDLERSIA